MTDATELDAFSSAVEKLGNYDKERDGDVILTNDEAIAILMAIRYAK